MDQKLRASRATWKIIASDMPLGLVVGDGTGPSGCPRFENSANGNGPVLGREFEIAEILTFIFEKAPPAGQANLPLSAGLQFFGQVDLDARSKKLTVSLKDVGGAAIGHARLRSR